MSKETFATAIQCMDGRSQRPTEDFIRAQTGAQYVDSITDPGIVRKFAEHNANPDFTAGIREQLRISVELHNSQGIVVSAHQECAGNPVSDDEQLSHLRDAVEVIRRLVPEGVTVPIYAAFIQRAVEGAEGWIAREVDLSSRENEYQPFFPYEKTNN